MNIQNLPVCVEDTYGIRYPVPQSEISFGGQGLFFAKDDLAVKILFPEDFATRQQIESDDKAYMAYQRKIIHLLSLPQIEHTSMPIASLKSPYCGYVMRFMSGLMPLSNLMTPVAEKEGGYPASYSHDNASLKKRITILRNLAEIMRNIHNKGLVYCDLTPSNVFVSEKAGEAEVWLIDIDNLEYGNELSTHWQTPWYRAPEVYNGQRNSTQADCYSFALIAFGLLTFSRPFDGKASAAVEENEGWDEEEAWGASPQPEEDMAQRKAESGEFSYVGENKTNNPQAYGIPYQYVMNEAIQELFLRTFCKEGRNNPLSRPSMNEWFKVLDEALGQIALCPEGHRHFGTKCFLCGNAEQKGQKRAIIYQINYYAKSTPSNDENQDVERVDQTQRKIYDLLFTTSSTGPRKRKSSLMGQIPWKCFASSEKTHHPDSIAFTISLSDSSMEILGNYDPSLHVSVKKNKNGEYVSVSYKDRFYYEINVEEVE